MKPRIIIVGKGGAGKDYLRNKMCARGYKKETSFTTRPARVGEVDGIDYHFISDIDFLNLQNNGLLYECAEFNGWKYGTTKNQWEVSDIFIMTPTGVSQITKEDRESCFIIYLDIPSYIRFQRLEGRMKDADTTLRRMKADEEDFKNFTDFDLRITSSRF